jgi:hypothetical protein
MIAIEIETSIVDHRLSIHSELLPASADRARVIVMYEEPAADAGLPDIVALARAAQASFPRRAAETLSQELAEMRGEWSRAQ